MTTSKLMHHTERKRIVIKLGGSMLERLSDEFFMKFMELRNEGNEIIIVHGGGPFINEALKKNGIDSKIDDGIRVTCEKSIAIVKQVLVGEVNTCLVHQLNQKGIEAIGLNGFDGKLLECSMLDEKRYGFVGDIQSVNNKIIEKLFAASIVPVISCLGATNDGIALNVNADTVASKVALEIGANSLLLVTDTPGIKIDSQLQQVASPSQLSEWVGTGDIYGGMIPKVNAAIACLNAGIPTVQIVDQYLTGTMIAYEEVLN
ncbi:acetylglutamate kinase [Sporosarcina highlanderae]|uniref:Acetylglutamate kinase n=1 Tax=Sporosarcina highlanderae TaxID=3035916 RepID=A0ABT8JSR6_9BACL|nr:acetylglutamate kinase [Sporosarcina highlanderae]MDN4607843.1 acetylglutamate kinase [Sporosarcina highlanderae]